MNTSLNASNSTEASFCLLFVENFQDVNFLLQFRWFFSNLWKPISCGRLQIAGSSSDWVVTSIVDSNNQSITLRDMTKKNKSRQHLKKRKQLFLLPSSSVLFTFSSYRLAICLEISPLVFCMRSDGKIPLDEMSESLHSMLSHIHQSLAQNISQVYISILAHHAHFTHCLYQGFITRSTSIQQVIDHIKPIFDNIEEIICARYQQASEKSSSLESYAASQEDTMDYFSPSPDGVGRRGEGRGQGRDTGPMTPAATASTSTYDPLGDPTSSDDHPSPFATTAMAAAAAAASSPSPSPSSSSSSTSSSANFMRVESICEGLHFHLNLLPAEACPVAVLITTGRRLLHLLDVDVCWSSGLLMQIYRTDCSRNTV